MALVRSSKLGNRCRMFWFVFTLVSLVSAVDIPCDEPDGDVGLPSECPPGQVLHRNVCRNYFLLTPGRKKCLLSEYVFNTKRVWFCDVICPLKEKPSNCSLYMANILDCLTLKEPLENLTSCKEYSAQIREHGGWLCVDKTKGIPHTGFMYNNGSDSFLVYPKVVVSDPGEQCPFGYCLSYKGICVRPDQLTPGGGCGGGDGIFHPVDRPTKFNHGNNQKATNADNFREHLLNSQKIG